MFSKKLIARLSLLATTTAFACSAIAASEFPTGTYTASDVRLNFDAQGRFRASIGEATMVEGSYTATHDTLSLTDASGPWACLKNPKERTGSYHWKLDRDHLTLTKLDDLCKDRGETLTPKPWAKES